MIDITLSSMYSFVSCVSFFSQSDFFLFISWLTRERRYASWVFLTWLLYNVWISVWLCSLILWPKSDKVFFFLLCAFSFSKNVDHDRMRKCLVTETETLLKLSGVKKISSVYFGGGKVFITSLQNPSIHVTLQFYKVICIYREQLRHQSVTK